MIDSLNRTDCHICQGVVAIDRAPWTNKRVFDRAYRQASQDATEEATGS
jgi:hypothetical protein